MDLELIKTKELPLLSRTRVSYWYDGKAKTPSRKDLIAAVSKKAGVKPEMVIIKHIYSQFGNSKVKIIAHLYKDKKKMELFEHDSLLKKHVEKKEDAPKQ